MDKVRKAIFMFVDLFGMERYNFEKLVNFMVTVKANYRSVVYHNWSHGFHVANSIYSILKASPGIYTPYEVTRNIQHRDLRVLFIVAVSWIVDRCHLPRY